ncbi:MAG: hypothetical protein IPK76_09380 [Lewinellaceae bacterium]|nr:hypothetical protein [Lewinellaceae bacterium]
MERLCCAPEFSAACLAHFANSTRIKPGTPIHINSLASTVNPHSLMKPPILIGETCIGRSGKNIRSVLKGHHRAQPRPPLVSMSSKGCESVDRKSHAVSDADEWLAVDPSIPPAGDIGSKRYNRPVNPLKTTAKAIEWVQPRCPHSLS